jgi:hypothetical protein
MKPYEYREHGVDAKLTIKSCGDGQNGAHVEVDGEYIDVEASAVPAAALALYEAAGLPEPLVLRRPEHTGGIEYAGSSDRYAFTSRVGPKIAIGWRGIEPACFNPDEALEFAAHIAANALAIKGAEPDPAEVDELAMALVEGTGAMGIGGARPLARKILLAAWKREQDDDR